VFFRPNALVQFAETVLDLGAPQVSRCVARHYVHVTQNGNQTESRTPISGFTLYTLVLDGLTLTGQYCQYFLDFLNARRGQAQGFRVRNPSDWELTKPLVSRWESQYNSYLVRYGTVLQESTLTGPVSRIYRVIEQRDMAGIVHREEKPVFKPRPYVQLWDGVADTLILPADYIVDYSSGQVVFNIAPPAIVYVTGAFDLPVRFSEKETGLELLMAENLNAVANPATSGLAAQFSTPVSLLCDGVVTRATIGQLSLVEFVPLEQPPVSFPPPPSGGGGEQEFVYQSDGDQNDLFNWLGTLGGTVPFSVLNLVPNIELFASNPNNSVLALFDRDNTTGLITTDQFNAVSPSIAGVGFRFKQPGWELNPTASSVRFLDTATGSAMYDTFLEGGAAPFGGEWQNLVDGTSEFSHFANLGFTNDPGVWVADLPISQSPSRGLRLSNANFGNSDPAYLELAEWQVYGTLTAPTPLVAPPANQQLFSYQSDGDTNDLFYWLGTLGNTVPFSLSNILANVQFYAGNTGDNADNLVDRDSGTEVGMTTDFVDSNACTMGFRFLQSGWTFQMTGFSYQHANPLIEDPVTTLSLSGGTALTGNDYQGWITAGGFDWSYVDLLDPPIPATDGSWYTRHLTTLSPALNGFRWDGGINSGDPQPLWQLSELQIYGILTTP
jgi:hypothetical protein